MKVLMLILSLLVSMTALAKVEALAFETPEQEAIYKSLTLELRCLVCQNQNIADSNAELAQDMRARTYELIKQGKSESEIIDYMVQRYGDFVMYRPPLKSTTLILWIGPFVIMAMAIVTVILFVRRRRKEIPVENDQEMLAEARKMLKGEKE